MAEIDSLQIEINASSQKANNQIDLLIRRLGKLDASLSTLNVSGLTALANGVNQLGSSMKTLNDSATNKDFSNLAKNLGKLSTVNTSSFFQLANAMTAVGNGAGKFGAATQAMNSFSASIKTLGGSGISKAVANIPTLSAEIQKMMSTLANAPAVSQNVIQMTNAMANLAAQGSKVGSAAKSINNAMAATTAGGNSASKAVTSFSSRLRGMDNVLNRSARSTRSLASAFGSFYANCFLLIRGIKAVSKAIDGSMDYVETYNYWNVTLGKIGKEFGRNFEKYGYDSAESYSNSFSERLKDLTKKMSGYSIGDNGELLITDVKNLGLDPEQLMSFQASISAVTNSLGLCGETSINTSKALSMLAADMSSFKNIDLKTVMTNLQSGLIGQSRALYKYGIDITNATLQTYAYKNGINMAVSEMTQADKMQLRLLAILDQSRVAWGDQANTISSVANQYRILKQQISNLARTIGNLFLPIVQKVLPVVNGLIIALQRLFATLGFKLFGGDWLKNLQDGISSGSGGDVLDDMADSAEDVANGLGDAEKNAKKLKGQLAGFDALNNLSSLSGVTSSNVGGGIDLSGAISDAVANYESIWDKALKDSENKAKEFADKVTSYFKKIHDAWVKDADMSFIGEDIGNALNNLLYSIDWESIKQIAYKLGKSLSTALSGFLRTTDWNEVGTAIAEFFNTLVSFAKGAAENFDFQALGLAFANTVNGFFATFDFAALAESINKFVQGLFKALKTAIANIDWGKVYDGIITFLENLDIETVAIIIGALTIKKILGLHLVSAALDMIGSAISKSLAGAIGKKLGVDLAKDVGLGAAFAGIGNQMGTTFMLGFKELLSGSWKAGVVPDGLSVAGISTIIGKLTGIGTVIGGAALAVTNFFSMWKDGFSWLKEILMVVGTALTAVGAVILGVAAAPAAIVAAIVAAVGTAAVVIHDNWDAICEWFSGLPEWFDMNVITPVCEFFKGLWDKVSGFFSGLWEDISAVWDTVSNWFNEHVIEPVSGFFEGLRTRVKQIFEGLWIIVQAVWVTVSDWFNEHVIEPVVSFFRGLWEKVSGFFSKLWEDICKIWSTVSEWFNTNVITPVVDWFQGLWDKISGFFSQLWEDIKGIWSTVSEWFNTTIITPLSNAFSKFKETVIRIFDGMWTGIKKGVSSAMNAVIGGIEKAINWIVGGINGILKGFNKVVSWAAKIVKADWGGVDLVPEVHLNRISMFENGGFPNTGELFMARENGITEMVGSMGGRPAVANNDQIVEGIAVGVENANAEQNNLLREQNMLLRALLEKETGITDGAIFESVRRSSSEYYRRTGTPAFG